MTTRHNQYETATFKTSARRSARGSWQTSKTSDSAHSQGLRKKSRSANTQRPPVTEKHMFRRWVSMNRSPGIPGDL
eukprot:CAMPEP_0115699006 /NCGR_PEP_ID=MMETSP0272-20121206/66644_1 /TAXON_ID=71861 /ORGANISM="Scrippsiella trochoidea, Strain CCMP3099" /LENGTH=75 /DNA_ID=CAMNT_0003139393 /DNA_START=357 /DNA_END=584 /DNA_ORIENTATION=+